MPKKDTLEIIYPDKKNVVVHNANGDVIAAGRPREVASTLRGWLAERLAPTGPGEAAD